MENVRSKRRPVPQQDEVDVALENMKHQWKYNPLRQYWLRYVIVGVIIFAIISWLAPAANSGGAGGVVRQLVDIGIQLATSAFIAVMFIFIQLYAIARPRIYWLKPYETGITFNDYKGNPQVLEMAREVVILLKGAKDFKNMGGEVIRGLLLEGDPGVGKSYLAQAIASEAGLPFGYCSSPSLQSPFLAGGMMSIKNLYKKARKLSQQYGGCILFLDEIDAIAQSRAGSGGGGMGGMMGGMMGMGGGGNLLINELLVQLDPPPVDERFSTKFVRWLGMDFKRKKAERYPVLSIGATNLKDTLDSALLRPGRFDRQIRVDKPDSDGRLEVIEYYLDKVNHDNIPMDRFVAETIGYTPVQIKYVINEAVIRAHFSGRDAITYRDLNEARSIYEVGIKQPIKSMGREEKRRLAYHETGHAVAQALLVPWEQIVKLTIVRHGNAYGFMQPKPLEEKHIFLKEELEVDIQVSLASRAAEELYLGSGSNGFYGDLNNATVLALHICGDIGLNGHLSSRTVLQLPGASLQIEVEAYLEEQMRRVKSLLEANSDMVHAIAAELMERDEMVGEELYEIINQFPAKLTTDAKNKRKRMGFRLEEGAPTPSSRGGMWTENRQTLAPTGTDGASSGAAAFRPATSNTGNSASVATPATSMPMSGTITTASYRVMNDAPGAAEGATTPKVVDSTARPSSSSTMAGAVNPIASLWEELGAISVEPTRVNTTPEATKPVAPKSEATKPEAPKANIDNEYDDLLPRGW